jgi:hypothetical protein
MPVDLLQLVPRMIRRDLSACAAATARLQHHRCCCREALHLRFGPSRRPCNCPKRRFPREGEVKCHDSAALQRHPAWATHMHARDATEHNVTAPFTTTAHFTSALIACRGSAP